MTVRGEFKCDCQSCGNPIAFPGEGLQMIVECPHCQSETKLSITGAEMIFQMDAWQTPEEKAEKAAQIKMLDDVLSGATVFHNLDTLKLSGDTVTIHKHGIANSLASGMNGPRSIQVSTITAVQMQPAGFLTVGYIIFAYAGSKPFGGGIWEATQDPDAFLFTNDKNTEVAEFKIKVEKKMRELRVSAQSAPKKSMADELTSLAQLKRSGDLTEQEYETAKRKLLSSA